MLVITIVYGNYLEQIRPNTACCH